MFAAPTIDRTLKSPGKCRAIANKKRSQCDKSPYTGDDEINPRFCYAHRTPQSRKLGEVDDPSASASAPTQVAENVEEDTNLHRPQAYYPSITENVEDPNLYPSPLQVPAQLQGIDAYASQSQELNTYPSQIDGFAFNPTSQIDTRFTFNSQLKPNQFDQEEQPRSPPNLEAVIAQLTRMELQSKEDVRRIDINYKSKVEDLETRVQHLERAQIPGIQVPADQMSSNEISKIVSLFEEHLIDVQQQHNINCDKRNEAKLRAAGLYRKSEAAHRAYGVALQRYHEKEQEYTLRNQQAHHLKGLEQRMITRIGLLRNSAGLGTGPEPGIPGPEPGMPGPEPENMES